MVKLADRQHIPQLTVIHLRSFGLTLSSLRLREDLPLPRTNSARTRLAPYLDCWSADAAKMAKAWASGNSSKWLQVEAVVRRLRSDFVHDPAVVVPADCEDPVGFFLEEGRGPDYLFATTAVLMLRSLGCPTRLVSGFYAEPERYDHRAGQTAVLAEDAHVWAEVCVDGHNWVPIEATPGYAPPSERLTVHEWGMQLAATVMAWCSRHWAFVTLVFAAFAAAAVWRVALLDLLGTMVCQLMAVRSAGARLYWTMRLLEWRAWLAGRRRPQGTTLANWYRPLTSVPRGVGGPSLNDFFGFVDCLLYAPPGSRLVDSATQREACRTAARVSRRQIHHKLVSPST